MKSDAEQPLHEELPTLYGLPGEMERRPLGKVAAGSVVFHLLLLVGLKDVPLFEGRVVRNVSIVSPARVTPLYLPPVEPTQKAPNRAKLNREFDVESLRPRPSVQVPQGQRSTTRPAARIPEPAVTPPQPQPIEPPRPIETPAVSRNLGTPATAGLPTAPPPQPPPENKAKIQFEAVGSEMGTSRGKGTGDVKIPLPPRESIAELARSTTRSSGGLTVGDGAGEGAGGLGEGLNLPPSPGKTGSNLELLSDPQGVDFRPYLVRVLALVRRNWMAVIPESARLGQRGRVAVQFSIDRQGKVPKLVIAGPSGSPPLDRAAVAGISASYPFPALPAEFKGDQIRLQFTFTYNMPAR